MKYQIIMNEQDIIQRIADSWDVTEDCVTLKHCKETVGYGYSEEEVDRVEVTITFPDRSAKNETKT